MLTKRAIIVAILAKIPNILVWLEFISPVIIGALISLPALTPRFEASILVVVIFKLSVKTIRPINAITSVNGWF